MIKMTRNISRVKITSDLQTKHELASNKSMRKANFLGKNG